MARPERIPLEVPAGVGVGTSTNVFRFRDKTVLVAGPFAGELLLEGSIDGEDFAPIGAPVTAPGFFLLPVTIAFLRVAVTQLASGTPRAVFAGFDYRAV
ncbi:MAG TPA: hypothetical protein VFP84_07485 [Kofleriaceae bacterium]|nr:hypothetical protein [Kofleriaceae bacterium]